MNTLHIIRWTLRDANTGSLLTEASGEGELDCDEPREDEALHLLADLCSMTADRLGVSLEESPRRVTMEVEVIRVSTEWDADGQFSHEEVLDSGTCDRVLPSKEG